VIYEVVTEGSAPEVKAPAPADGEVKPKKKSKGKQDADDDRSSDPTVGVGSVAAGGRYDHLVGMFSGKTQIRKFQILPHLLFTVLSIGY